MEAVPPQNNLAGGRLTIETTKRIAFCPLVAQITKLTAFDAKPTNSCDRRGDILAADTSKFHHNVVYAKSVQDVAARRSPRRQRWDQAHRNSTPT